MSPDDMNVAFLSRRVGSAAVSWLFTGLLIAVSLGTVAFTGYLLRRLFTTAPGLPDTPTERTS